MTKFKGWLNFSNGENALFMSQKIKLLDIRSVGDPSCEEIKKAIAKRFNLSLNMITVGNGSDEIIENIPRLFVEPGDFVLIIAPTFFRFIESSLKMKGKILTVFTKEKDNFKFTKEVIKKTLMLIDKFQPKIIWLCSPNNPTGETMTLEQIEMIVKKSKNLVVVDEAFQEFIDVENKKSAINLLKNHNNLLILRTFSKSWGLGGVRFGFGISSSAIIKPLEKWRLSFNVNYVTRKIVLTLLKQWNELSLIVNEIAINRRELFNKIKQLNNLVIGADSKTNIFILKHKTKDIFQELLKRHILGADLRNIIGLEGKNFVRLTVKTPKENKILLKALKEIDQL